MGQKGSKGTATPGKSSKRDTQRDDSESQIANGSPGKTPSSPKVDRNDSSQNGGGDDEMDPSWNDEILYNSDSKK